MNSKRYLLSLLLISLSLVSCGGNPNNPHINKNGDLDVLSEITYENAFVNANSTYMHNMIESNEQFIFYLTSSECHHCYEFQDKILDYVKSTHNLIAKMDLVAYDEADNPTYSEDFKIFLEEYGEYFFVNDQVLTPQVYIVNGKNVATKVPSSRYSTSIMFSNAMNDYVYASSVYTLTSKAAYLKFLEKHDESMTIIINRANTESTRTYESQISSIIKNSSKSTALIELNESNKDEILSYLGIESFVYPVGTYQKGESRDSYTFNGTSEDNKAFLDKYM